MFIASTHLQPVYTLSPAFLLAAWLMWYWARVGKPDVPRARRIIRRTSIIATLLAIIPFVRALSYIDPSLSDESKREYIITWTVFATLLLIIVVIAVIDLFHSLRLQRAAQHEILLAAAKNLVEARQSAAAAPASAPGKLSHNGERDHHS